LCSVVAAVDIKSATKEECEDLLKASILEHLDKLGDDEKVMLKVSIPTKVNHYKECIDHPKVIRVVALSGGYSREEANRLLKQQTGMIASFSRALSEGLSHGMSQDDFDKTLAESVESIFQASKDD
jgi:fructose-bisphosphate aldolase, class I